MSVQCLNQRRYWRLSFLKVHCLTYSISLLRQRLRVRRAWNESSHHPRLVGRRRWRHWWPDNGWTVILVIFIMSWSYSQGRPSLHLPTAFGEFACVPSFHLFFLSICKYCAYWSYVLHLVWFICHQTSFPLSSESFFTFVLFCPASSLFSQFQLLPVTFFRNAPSVGSDAIFKSVHNTGLIKHTGRHPPAYDLKEQICRGECR